MNSRPAWSTEQVPGQAQSYIKKPCLENKKKEKKTSLIEFADLWIEIFAENNSEIVLTSGP